MAKVYFSTGSNQGDRLGMLVKAAKLVKVKIGRLVDYSPVVESEPLGFKAETSFYNQVLEVETQLLPEQLILSILDIEQTLGRIRSGNTYTSRNIDIDILFYDELVITGKDLIIPHPRLHERNFVLKPLAAIAPGFRHPLLNNTVDEMLSRSKDNSTVTTVIEKNEFANLLV